MATKQKQQAAAEAFDVSLAKARAAMAAYVKRHPGADGHLADVIAFLATGPATTTEVKQ